MNTDELGWGMRGVLTVCLLLVSAPCFGQHAGLRQQWQPQTESDPRLQQRVETELTCISTRRGLPRLAEKTGVSLSVAAENLDTAGEREFTLIAKGCTLKEVMVQLCEALRECHWDVDSSGAQPAYLLHRNAGVEAAEEERQEGVQAAAEARQREERTTRIEEARRALAMTPEEVAQLEETDLLLARALRYPLMRGAMEALFAFPPEQIRQFAETGQLSVPYSELPERAQRLLRRAAMEWAADNVREIAANPDEKEYLAEAQACARALPERIAEATVRMRSYASFGLVLGVGMEGVGTVNVTAIPGWRTTPNSSMAIRLLVATGDTPEAAKRAVRDRWMQWQQQRKQEEEQRLQARVLAPEVEQVLTTPLQGTLHLSALEKAVAEQAGLSVIADAYWYDEFEIQTGTDPRLTQLPSPASVRQALDGAAPWAVFEWWTSGRCLIIRAKDFDWYDRAERDVPESAVLRYREKLRTQGQFTLDDAVALALEVSNRSGITRRGGIALPDDLRTMGLGDLAHPMASWAAALLVSVTPEQRARAERAEGLRLADLSRRQRDKAAGLTGGRWGQAMEELAAVFRITKSEGVEEGRRYTQYDFRLEWGEDEEKRLTAWVRLFDTPPAASDDGRG
jgi:hypothetical protein